jgi:hypothetical protein
MRVLTHLVSRAEQADAIELTILSEGRDHPVVLTLCGRTHADLQAAGDRFQLCPGLVTLAGTELCPMCALEFEDHAGTLKKRARKH